MFGLLGAVLDTAICEETPSRPHYDWDFVYDINREAEIDRLELENLEYLTKEERRKALKKAEKRKMQKEIKEAKERLEKMLRELE